jgi:hypothetical protein
MGLLTASIVRSHETLLQVRDEVPGEGAVAIAGH